LKEKGKEGIETTMATKVGRIPYLSCEPFYFAMERRGVALYDVVPSALADAAATGKIDAAPIPLTDCFRLDERFRFLSGFCLATIRKAGSVLLHAKHPIQALTGARIGLSAEAATAVRLLQVVLALKYQVQSVTYVALEDDSDACLLVGNEGLRQRHGVPGYWATPTPTTWEKNGTSGPAYPLCSPAGSSARIWTAKP
jgi:predicted solute-binding protein